MSGFERGVLKRLDELEMEYEYQPKKHFSYTLHKKYRPDFLIGDTFVETKGWFRPEDRTKMRRVQQCNPDEDILLVFQKDQRIGKSPRSLYYTQWAEKHGFRWRVGYDWIQEEEFQGTVSR